MPAEKRVLPGESSMSIDYAKACRTLARRDPVIGNLMRLHGACGLADAQHQDPFRALVHAIISQQLSSRAAATIEGRFDALFAGRPTPGDVSRVADERLRAVGLSGQKVRYVRDLCARIGNGSLDLQSLDEQPDEAVVEALTQVKGIGRWTAEMFLMFRLHRPDVLPIGDLGIVKAVQKAYKLRKAPTPERLTRLGEPWRPYRSVACWYLWASLDNIPVIE
jgi:DNA-3-methyladenine glycosylase II